MTGSRGLSESSNPDALYDELREAGPLPDVPLTVLRGTAVDDFKRAVSAGVSEQALLGEVDSKRGLTTSWPSRCRAVRTG